MMRSKLLVVLLSALAACSSDPSAPKAAVESSEAPAPAVEEPDVAPAHETVVATVEDPQKARLQRAISDMIERMDRGDYLGAVDMHAGMAPELSALEREAPLEPFVRRLNELAVQAQTAHDFEVEYERDPESFRQIQPDDTGRTDIKRG